MPLRGSKDTSFPLGLRRSLQAQSYHLRRQAAAQGFAVAQANLGNMYNDGRGGLPKDDAQAVAWYRKAAAQRNDIAIKSLVRLGAN